ncbi:MAG: universal stress protein [Kiloniellales bacterium]|nr:universal stress protein [Kiloniellales bacterium]
MIRTILTPLDGSRHAGAALDLSVDLAKVYNARLILLHVGLRDGDVPQDLYDSAARELAQAEDRGDETGIHPHLSEHLRVLEYLGHKILREAQAAAAKVGVETGDSVIDFGDAGERILHHAKHKSADLIVMGSRGYGELEGLFLGSVSHKVFHLAPCACVTVHRAEGEAGFRGLGTILAATDGSAHATKSVELASDIAARYGAKLVLLHALRREATAAQLRAAVDPERLGAEVREELEMAERLVAMGSGAGLLAAAISEAALKAIGEGILEQGAELARAKSVDKLETRLVDDDPARAVLATAKSEKADLIALGSRGLGEVQGLLAGSVSYKVNHAAPCTCLVVR